MSKKSNGGRCAFWLGFFLVAVLPKLIAKENTRLEWTLRFIFLAIVLSPFWIGFLLSVFDGVQ